MQEIRVHSDRRACISAPILKSFAHTAGLHPMPKRVYVGREPTGIVLRWKPFAGSKSYDLSVRDRVLVGGFEPGTTLSIATESADKLLLVRDQSPTVSTPKVSTPKVSTPQHKETPVQRNLRSLIIAGLCTDVRRNHTQCSLIDVAKTLDNFFSGITVEEFLNADGHVIIDYAKLFPNGSGARGPNLAKKKPPVRVAAPAPKAERGPHVGQTATPTSILDRLRAADRPLSILDFGSDRESHRHCREVLNALIEDGRVVKTGNTRATRYHLAK